MSQLILYRANSNRLALLGLRDATGAYLQAAAVAVTLTDAAGAEVGGAVWPLELAYYPGGLTDSETGQEYPYGCYAVDLPYDLDVDARERLTAIVAASADGLRGQWELPVLVINRTGD